jgi:hypothetical protein
VPNTFRVANDDDVVPHIPARVQIHIGAPCTGASANWHHGTEIWYPEVEHQNGVMCDYRECTHDPSGRGEDYSCSDHVSLNSIADHTPGYFEVVPPRASIQSSFCGLPSAHAHPKPPQLAKPCSTPAPTPAPEHDCSSCCTQVNDSQCCGITSGAYWITCGEICPKGDSFGFCSCDGTPLCGAGTRVGSDCTGRCCCDFNDHGYGRYDPTGKACKQGATDFETHQAVPGL